MTLTAYDAANAPALDLITAAGGAAVMGYLTGNYAASTFQAAPARDAGLGWGAVYEQAPGELVGATYTLGVDIGHRIAAALPPGFPTDGTAAVYVSVDVEVSEGQESRCFDGFRGIRSVLAPRVQVRCYGQGSLILALAVAGLTDGPGWLSASSSYPGFDPASPHVCLVQSHDAAGNWLASSVPGTDVNTITQPNVAGLWWPDGSPYAEVDMLLDPNDPTVKKLLDATYPGNNPAYMDNASIGSIFHALGVIQDPAHVASLPAIKAELDVILAKVAGIAPTSTDPAAIAAAVAGLLPADLATQVVAELGKLLSAPTPPAAG